MVSLQYVVSGSDDFRVYVWKVPTDADQKYHLSAPQGVLPGTWASMGVVPQGTHNRAWGLS